MNATKTIVPNTPATKSPEKVNRSYRSLSAIRTHIPNAIQIKLARETQNKRLSGMNITELTKKKDKAITYTKNGAFHNNVNHENSLSRIVFSNKRNQRSEEEFIKVQNNDDFFRSCSLRYTAKVTSRLEGKAKKILDRWLATKAGQCVMEGYSNVEQAIKSGEMLKCALYYMHNNPLRVTLKATENIKEGECIGIYTGVLQTASSFLSRENIHMESVWAFDIPCDVLPDYPGEALVIQAVDGGNISRFIQDSIWHDYQGNNIKAVPIYYKAYKPGVFVAFIAEHDIYIGEEILMDWGTTCRELIQLQQLDGQCSLSFYNHFYIRMLQKNVDTYVPIENLSVKDFKPVPLEIDILKYDMFQGRYVENKLVNNAAILEHMNRRLIQSKKGLDYDSDGFEDGPPRKIPKKLPDLLPNDGTVDVDTEWAFEYRKCRILRKPRIDLTQSTIEKLNAVKHKLLLRSILQKFFPKGSSIPQKIINGYVPKAKVVEVISIGHPVRWYAPPNDRSFALAASEYIKKDEPIGLYIGRLTEEVKDEGEFDSYAFAVTVEGVKMVMENLRSGNECRFINDKFRREAGDASVNSRAFMTWITIENNWIPAILFKATRVIHKDEEIVTDYGTTFWKKIYRNASFEHQEFNVKAQAKLDYLIKLHHQHGIPLPKWPKELPAKFVAGIDYDEHLEEEGVLVLDGEEDGM